VCGWLAVAIGSEVASPGRFEAVVAEDLPEVAVCTVIAYRSELEIATS